jgi:hypothetical protein
MTMTTNDLFNAVMQLDLEPIKMKLMHVESGEGWSVDKVNAVEKEYRRFLCLMKLYPEEDTAPLVDVDTFWHYHILDTMKYAADCERAFGYFLHHYPYVGMRGEDDEQFRLDSGKRMGELYEATFGEAYPGTRATAEPALDGADTAFCAGPHQQATAFCAGPHARERSAIKADTAFCAGPHKQATAFCAGPHAKKRSAIKADTAFCAGPHKQATAFCAGPHAKKRSAIKADTAFCAGPHKQATAFCAGPHKQATAFCAGPHAMERSAIKADTAFCAGPHQLATAFCAGPHTAAKAA